MQIQSLIASLTDFSPNKEHRDVKIVMNQAAVDIWRIGTSGEVDMQMSRALSSVVLRYIPKCRIVVQNVETHVQIAEEELEQSSHDDAQTDWEKAAMEALQPDRVRMEEYAVNVVLNNVTDTLEQVR